MDFHRWMMASRKSGLFTFEFDLEALVQVQPDADTDRDLRELWSLRERGTADVDLRWERHTLANLITRHFYDLALVATGKRKYVSIPFPILRILTTSWAPGNSATHLFKNSG